jgi:twitching motility protein PilT
MPSDSSRVDRFLTLLKDWGASDLHLSVGRAPLFRVDGELRELRYRQLTPGDFQTLVQPVTPPALWERFQTSGDVDFAYELQAVSRFRVNLFRQHRGAGAVFRNLAAALVSLERLQLPSVVSRATELRSGLVLVTGPTGSGKSTTLAALIAEMNQRRPMHFITIEDPVEFVHHNQRALVSQREVGTDVAAFAPAVRAAMRENPDCILVGELRDLETISAAIQAAETGILVLGTLHTNSAAKTIDRLINAYPVDRQPGVRGSLANVLRMVIAQQLLPRQLGGRVAAVEVLLNTFSVASMIREGKVHQVANAILAGKKDGMVSLDETLQGLVADEVVEPAVALDRALDPDAFREFLVTRGVRFQDDEVVASPR